VQPDEMISLFVPHIVERRQVFAAGKRLVHYTSAESAYKIISGKQIWLRNAQMMNDFSEIQHGLNCLVHAWASDAGGRLQQMLDRLKAGLANELANLFNGHAEALRIGTFITSLSEHEDEEDEYGRLSMWRAYGGRSGVALVLNNTVFAAETDEMRVFSSPVFYMDVPKFVERFQGWAGSLLAAEDRLRELGAEQVTNLIFMVFRSFALCTKHPGFREEKEWRVYHSPMFEGRSDWIEPATECVEGVPQLLMKLHLRDDSARGIPGVAPATRVDRVIIGPCDYPVQVRAGVADALQKAGIDDPLSRMSMSLIPLRHRD
jgi:hypothetical protein